MKKITVINNAIQQAISVVTAKAGGKTLQEPDYSAAFAIELPPIINANKISPNIHFGGCFIHQSPMATFAGQHANQSICEVGDLLVLCHEKVDGDDRYNAALIQWKKLNTGSGTISGSALKQLDLYEHWPSFTLKSGKSVSLFDILPKTVSPGAQYGLIFPSSSLSLFCRIPSKDLQVIDSPSFARFLINLMKWQTGRPVVLDGDSGKTDEWSKLIEYLIQNSLKSIFTRRNINTVEKRASKDLLKMLISNANEGPFELQSTEEGISILFIDKE